METDWKVRRDPFAETPTAEVIEDITDHQAKIPGKLRHTHIKIIATLGEKDLKTIIPRRW